MRWIIALLVTFSPALAYADDGFQFPKGIPQKANEVEWYPRNGFGGLIPIHEDGLVLRGPGGSSFGRFRQTWNMEFPWITGGLDKSDNVQTHKFHKDARSGSITYWKEYSNFFSNARQIGFTKFRIPKGELFGEVVSVDGRTTEVRLLEGTGQDDPRFRVFRPFAKRSEIAKWITKETLSRGHLADPHGILNETALVDDIEVSPEGATEILSRPFKDVTDIVFSEANSGLKAFAPTTTQRNGIVGRFSQGGFLHSQTCIACHRTAGMEGRLVDPNPRPDKYGNIRGGAGVFSAPFADWIREGRIKQRPDAPVDRPHRNSPTEFEVKN